MPFLRKSTTIPLAVAMTGVKMGDQVLFVGYADRALLVDVAAKVGLSGRACLVTQDQNDAARARDAAARAGILVEVETVLGAFPLETGIFDLAVVDNTSGWLAASRPEVRVGLLQEAFRVLRPGGRCVVIEAGPRGGVLGVLSRHREDPHFSASGGSETALGAEGFSGVRVLAEREGRRFVEGTKR